MNNLSERIANLSAERRELLGRMIKEQGTGAADLSGGIPRRHDPEALSPLSFAQERLWFLYHMEPEQATYNAPVTIRLRGQFNFDAFKRGLAEVVRRHSVLRATFEIIGGKAVQKIGSAGPIDIPFIDLRRLAPPEREAEARRMAEKEVSAPFDLRRGPLLRASMLRLGDDEHIALIMLHHIVFDGWSLGIFLDELMTLYGSCAKDDPSPLPDPPAQYSDFAQWERERLTPQALEVQLDFWRRRLGASFPVLRLPFDRPRPDVQTSAGDGITRALPHPIVQGLKSLSQREGVTLFMTLVALYKTLLFRYSGQADIFIGTAIANRLRPEWERLIGFFANTIVLRTDLSGDPSFRELLQRVRSVALEAYDYQETPFEQVVSALRPERDPSRSPLFQAMFVMQDSSRSFGASGLDVELLDPPIGISRFDLTLLVTEYADELKVTLAYNSDLFDHATAARLLNHFQSLAAGVTTEPEKPLSQLSLLTEEEHELMLAHWNRTSVPYRRDLCAHQMFEEQVERTPEAIAVTFEGQQLSYRELNERANQLANYLRKLGVGPEVLVGVCVERSPEMIIAALGALKAGGAYVPVDPTYPQERQAFMLRDSQARALLTQARLLDGLPPHQAQIVCLDADWPAISRERKANPESRVAGDNLAYVIYTSGSTGKPKGTLLHHRGLCNFASAYIKDLGVSSKSRFLQFASFSFDASIAEISTALLSGATLCLASRETLLSGPSLIQLLRDEGITAAILPPSMLKLLPAEGLPRLRTVISAGEACSREIVERWAPGRRFYNAYGPTEATIGPTMGLVNEVPPKRRNIPIGRPIDNTQIYLLDCHQQPAPVGAPGEIYVGGVGVARGYLNRPELTAEKFIPDPFGQEPGTRFYRTGDRARYLPDGNIEYLERIDRQVKLHGYRIELEEIEAQLERHTAVRQAVVCARDDKAGNQRLVAYLVPQERRRLELWPSVAEYFIYDDLLYYAMTHDERRNRSYQVAINQAVKDKVVLDIGTGQDAILARFCVEAGARRVYAVELLAESFQKAKARIQQLGLEDRIILIHGDVTQTQLPEKVDVCVSEIVGAIGGTEGASLIINDAWRHLKGGGVMIPSRSLTLIAAVSLPEAKFLAQPGFAELPAGYVEKIFAHVGHRFDLRLCFKGLTPSDLISEAGVFEDLDFTGLTSPEYQRELTLRITKDGRMDGFLVWLQLHTTPGEVIDILKHEHCWLPVYFPVFYPGIELSRGDVIRAQVTATLCENKLNPDYRISGQLIRAGGESFDFDYTSHHYKPIYRKTPFYRSLFAGDDIPVISGQPVSVKSQELRAYLKDRIPEYMIPATYVTLESLPLTPNGKVDRGALPSPDGARPSLEVAFAAPHTEIERELAEVWRETLGVERVGVNDNFFDLGGDSLRLLQLQQKLQERLRRELPLMTLFKYPTVGALARQLGDDGKTEEPSSDRAQKQRMMIERRKKSARRRPQA